MSWNWIGCGWLGMDGYVFFFIAVCVIVGVMRDAVDLLRVHGASEFNSRF